MGSQSDLGLEFEWPGVYGSCREVSLGDLNKPVHRILLICALFVFVGKGAWSRTVVLNHGFTLETKKILIPRCPCHKILIQLVWSIAWAFKSSR